MGERELTLFGGQGHIPQVSMVTSSERSMEITAHFSGCWDGEEGVLLSAGENLGGYTLYIKSGRLVYEHVRYGARHVVEGAMQKGAKRCSLVMHVGGDKSARAKLFVDRRGIGEGHVPRVSSHLSFWGLDLGRDGGKPVSQAYDAPFAFPDSKLDRVVMRFFEEVEANELAAALEAVE